MLDTLIITEKNLDSTFLVSLFNIDGYSKPYRLNRNRNGAGTIIYVRADIPIRILTKRNLKYDIKGLFIELNFRKSKWLLNGMYHPSYQPDQYFVNALDKDLDVF